MFYIIFCALSLFFIAGIPEKLLGKCACLSTGARRLRIIEVRHLVAAYPAWKQDLMPTHSQLVRVNVGTFNQQIPHLITAATVAESLNHHPDIFVTPTELRIELHTHSQQELTEKDAAFVTSYESTVATMTYGAHAVDYVDLAAVAVTPEAFVTQYPRWRLTSAGLVLHSEQAGFEKAAQQIAACCSMQQVSGQVQEIQLSYGEYTITLGNSEGYISPATLVAAEICERGIE